MWYLHMYLVCARLSYSIKNTPVGALDGSLWEYFFHIQQFLANRLKELAAQKGCRIEAGAIRPDHVIYVDLYSSKIFSCRHCSV